MVPALLLTTAVSCAEVSELAVAGVAATEEVAVCPAVTLRLAG